MAEVVRVVVPEVLRLAVPTVLDLCCPGLRAIAGGRFTFPLERLRAWLTTRRSAATERTSDPLPPRHAWDAEQRRREAVLLPALTAALENVIAALARGEDFERAYDIRASQGIHPTGHPIDRFGRVLILKGEFLTVECGGCGRFFAPAECGVSAWGAQVAPKIGFGGKVLNCPLGHALFFCQTWVS